MHAGRGGARLDLAVALGQQAVADPVLRGEVARAPAARVLLAQHARQLVATVTPAPQSTAAFMPPRPSNHTMVWWQGLQCAQ